MLVIVHHPPRISIGALEAVKPGDKVKVESRNNWYWNSSGAKVQFTGKSLEDWQKDGHEKGSSIVDPLFENPERRDFRFKPDSPVLKQGFKPFDCTKAGVYGNQAWIAKAKEVKYPPLELPYIWLIPMSETWILLTAP